jgi:hypothetical protein
MRARDTIIAPPRLASPATAPAPSVRASRTPCYKTLQKATKNRALSKHSNPPLNPMASLRVPRDSAVPSRAPRRTIHTKSAERTHVPICPTRQDPPQPAQTRHKSPSANQTHAAAPSSKLFQTVPKRPIDRARTKQTHSRRYSLPATATAPAPSTSTNVSRTYPRNLWAAGLSPSYLPKILQRLPVALPAASRSNGRACDSNR